MITGHEHRPVAVIDDADYEHPAQPQEHRLAQLLVEVRQHFGVRHGPQPMAAFDQLLSELEVVEDLAVEEALDASVLVRERLIPGREIDDRGA